MRLLLCAACEIRDRNVCHDVKPPNQGTPIEGSGEVMSEPLRAVYPNEHGLGQPNVCPPCRSADGSRIIFRLSGTGSVGATVRMYIEKYQAPDAADALEMETADALKPLVDLALDLAQVREFTGRDEPTVIT